MCSVDEECNQQGIDCILDIVLVQRIVASRQEKEFDPQISNYQPLQTKMYAVRKVFDSGQIFCRKQGSITFRSVLIYEKEQESRIKIFHHHAKKSPS